MNTMLVDGMAVPLWDASLVKAMLAAVQGASKDLPVRRMAIRNSEGAIYRRVRADGQEEFLLLMKLFTESRFDLHLCGGEVVASMMPAPVGAQW